MSVGLDPVGLASAGLQVEPASGSGGLSLIPGVLALALSTFAPTVAQTQNVALTPGVAALALATYAPTVTQGQNAYLTPGAAALALTTYAPDLALSGVTTATGVGGYPSKKRYIVKRGDKIFITTSRREAEKAASQPEEVDEDTSIPENEAAPSKESPPETVAEFKISHIKAAARQFDATEQLQNLFKAQQYLEIVRLYEKLREQQDEEEVELLLMAV